MLERGVLVSYGTVRRRCAKFGQGYAGALRRPQPRPGDERHLDEGFIKINGERKRLWRAADADGTVFRSTSGAQRFLAALSGISPHFRPRRHLMVTPATEPG
jgi:putative transposase